MPRKQDQGRPEPAERRRCPHEHQRVKRRYIGHVEQFVDLPEWTRCVLDEGHDGEHEYED